MKNNTIERIIEDWKVFRVTNGEREDQIRLNVQEFMDEWLNGSDLVELLEWVSDNYKSTTNKGK